jgi:hypothetical protein
MPTVLIPTAYRGPTKGVAEVEVAVGSARACLESVAAQHPGFGDLVFDKDGGLHRFVTLFINGEQLEDAPLDRAVGETDRLEVLAAIAGG